MFTVGGPGVKGKVAPKRQIVDSKQAGTPDTKKPHTQPQSEVGLTGSVYSDRALYHTRLIVIAVEQTT